MKILIVVFKILLGGHVISAHTTARELKKRGHDVAFAGGIGNYVDEIQKEFPFYQLEIPLYYYKRQTYFRWAYIDVALRLCKITKENNFGMIHAFDARSYIVACICSILNNIPITGTLCGGKAPYYNLPQYSKIIVFSEEQKQKMIGKYGWKEHNVTVIRNRMDITHFHSNNILENMSKKYNINFHARNIMMISRFDKTKVRLKYVMSALEPVFLKYHDVNMVFIGGQGESFEEGKRVEQNINKKFGCKKVLFTGSMINASKLLVKSHLVLGVGRSAFEGMALGKPTLIVGEKGYAGSISPDKIEEIAYFNFSGRNNRTMTSPEKLTNEIIRLLSNREYYDRLSDFGKNYIKSELDVRDGIPKIEKVYNQNLPYPHQVNRIKRTINMIPILTPILIDNYYNAVKKIFIN